MILKRALILLTVTCLWACLPDKPVPPNAPPAVPQKPAKPTLSTQPSANAGTANNQQNVQASDAMIQAQDRAMQMKNNGEATQAEIDAKLKAVAAAERNSGQQKQAAQQNQPTPKKKSVHNLPASACNLLTEEFIGEAIGIDYRYISTKSASGGAEFQRSCFFRWDQDDTPNAGVLVQVQVNPIKDDFPDWADHYIPSKKSSGDNAPDGSATYTYKDFDGVGEEGAYNHSLGRYYWRTKDDRICMVAFNIPTTEQQQLIWAKKIGKEVMRNL